MTWVLTKFGFMGFDLAVKFNWFGCKLEI